MIWLDAAVDCPSRRSIAYSGHSDDAVDTWLEAETVEALMLQRRLPDDAPRIVA